MTFKEKCSHAEKLVESKKAAFSGSKPALCMDLFSAPYGPPVHRLLWKIGFEIPPPHFLSYEQNRKFFRLLAEISFGIMFVLLLPLVFFLITAMGLATLLASLISLVGSFWAGMVSGYNMGKLNQRESSLYQIPLWEDFHPEVSDPL